MLVGLLFGCGELAIASSSMKGYVSVTSHNSPVWGKISREHSHAVSRVFHVSSVDKSDCTTNSGELVGVALSFWR